jgi:hypothetical protein
MYNQYFLASGEALVLKNYFILKKILNSCKESGVSYIYFVCSVTE